MAQRIQAESALRLGSGVAALADLAKGWIALAGKPAAERKLALVMSDYPARGGRAGFAVGLDTPTSVTAIRELLAGAGYEVGSTTSAVIPGLTRDPCWNLHRQGSGMNPGSPWSLSLGRSKIGPEGSVRDDPHFHENVADSKAATARPSSA